LYEILLFAQRYIENEKIPVGKNGQFMKASHQQTLTKKLFFFKASPENHKIAVVHTRLMSAGALSNVYKID